MPKKLTEFCCECEALIPVDVMVYVFNGPGGAFRPVCERCYNHAEMHHRTRIYDQMPEWWASRFAPNWWQKRREEQSEVKSKIEALVGRAHFPNPYAYPGLSGGRDCSTVLPEKAMADINAAMSEIQRTELEQSICKSLFGVTPEELRKQWEGLSARLKELERLHAKPRLSDEPIPYQVPEPPPLVIPPVSAPLFVDGLPAEHTWNPADEVARDMERKSAELEDDDKNG